MRREIELEEVLKKSIKDLRIISLKEKLEAKGNPYETYFHLLGKKDAPHSKDANLYFLSMKYRNVMSRKILLLALPVFAVRKCYEDDDNTIIIDVNDLQDKPEGLDVSVFPRGSVSGLPVAPHPYG